MRSLTFFLRFRSWLLKEFHIGQIVRVVKFVVVVFTYIAHFEGKVRNYTATKLFQLNYRRAVRNARRAGRLFPARLRHRVRPSHGTFFNGFAKKKLAGPYGSYDKAKYLPVQQPSHSVNKCIRGDNENVCNFVHLCPSDKIANEQAMNPCINLHTNVASKNTAIFDFEHYPFYIRTLGT